MGYTVAAGYRGQQRGGHMADIGEEVKEVTFEPLEVPAPAPVKEPVPA